MWKGRKIKENKTQGKSIGKGKKGNNAMGSTWIPMTSIEDLTTRSSTFMVIRQTRKTKTKKEWEGKNSLLSNKFELMFTLFQSEEKKYRSEEGNITNGLK